MIYTDFKLKHIKLVFSADRLQDIPASDLKLFMAEEFTPEPWAPDKMVRVLTDCMVKDFQFHFHNLRDSGASATMDV